MKLNLTTITDQVIQSFVANNAMNIATPLSVIKTKGLDGTWFAKTSDDMYGVAYTKDKIVAWMNINTMEGFVEKSLQTSGWYK